MKRRDKTTYLDNGATSFPKPPEVLTTFCDYVSNIGASPGRGTYRAAEIASEKIEDTRNVLAKLFNAPAPCRMIFTKNATEGMNLALFGILQPGDKVVTSRMEHNAVIRPLAELERRGIIDVLWTKLTPDARLDMAALYENMSQRGVALVVLTGISNSTGVINPIGEIGEFCSKHNILFMVDGAQLCGTYPVDIVRDKIDILVFTGHKSLFGVPGTGGVYISERFESRIKPFVFGGTGTMSDIPEMPAKLPGRYEAGTPNTPGIVALGAGASWVLSRGVEKIHAHKVELLEIMHNRLLGVDRVKLFGPQDTTNRSGVFPIIVEGFDVKELSGRLWNDYGIATRAGCHCAPHLHIDLGYPKGTTRFSFGAFNTTDDAEYATESILDILR